MEAFFKKDAGMTLTELLVALVVGALILAGVYRTFAGQQKTYAVQEKIVDTQQAARLSIERMIREIRMAGFGNILMVLPVTLSTGTYSNFVNPDAPSPGSLTILSAIQGAGSLTVAGNSGQNQITVSTLTDSQGNPLFDTVDRKYISVGGVESHRVTAVDNGTNTVTLADSLILNHPVGTSVFGIRAISYQVVIAGETPLLMRNENVGTGNQPVADNIESLQYRYTLANGTETDLPANPAEIRMVRVSVTARTAVSDPDLKEGDGYRRRQFASNIHLKNMGIGRIAP
jgi:prepilin-type N-terminal cleavage/methylation domain-containing protein